MNETSGALWGADKGEADELLMRVCVLNEQGLHARPAARLAQQAQQFEASLTIRLDGQEVDAKSILDVLTLAAGKGSILELRANGPDAQDALDCLAGMFKNRFK